MEDLVMIPLPGGGYWIIGNRDPNRIEGTLFDDLIEGRGGDDTIRGDAPPEFDPDRPDASATILQFGDDRIYAGGGDDEVIGDALLIDKFDAALVDEEPTNPFGRDDIFGQRGDDFLAGDGGEVLTRREASPVAAEEEAEIPVVYDFAPGNDDHLRGGLGNDTIFGEGGDDHAYGNAGMDYLNGGLGRDHLKGGSGMDVIDGGADADKMWGGWGPDKFVLKQGEIQENDFTEQAAATGGGLGWLADLFKPFDGDQILDFNKRADKVVLVVEDRRLAATDEPQEAVADIPVVVESLGFGYFEVFFGSPNKAQGPEEIARDGFDPIGGEVFYVRGVHKVDDLNIEVIGGTLVDDFDDVFM